MADVFKLALGAGHRRETAGKRLPKELDPNETREWELNDRIADKVELKLSDYEGIQILRVDDTEGVQDVTLAQRVEAANQYGADLALAIHHNAAGRVFSGGGIVVYRAPGKADADNVAWQEELYAALIKRTGLKGNRADPMAESALYMLRYTKMRAILLELGFMDSTVDAPIILTEEYAEACATAIVEVIVKRAGLKKKQIGNPVAAHTVNVYRTLYDVPVWYQSTIQKLMDAGALKGVDEHGTINVDETYCRVMTTLDRLGKI